MIEQEKINEILQFLGSASVGDRLKGVEKAQQISKRLFRPNFTVEQWARAAITVETLYNLLRDELRQKQVRLTDRAFKNGATNNDEAVVPKPKGSKAKISKLKSKSSNGVTEDFMDTMLEEFLNKKKGTNG